MVCCVLQGIKPTAEALGITKSFGPPDAVLIRNSILMLYLSYCLMEQKSKRWPHMTFKEIAELDDFKDNMGPFITPQKTLLEAFAYRK
jgi:hypothetical protein